jgi:ABC-type multidrug transport system ATPase subunit/ABC-type multidrug transport system permease subunit
MSNDIENATQQQHVDDQSNVVTMNVDQIPASTNGHTAVEMVPTTTTTTTSNNQYPEVIKPSNNETIADPKADDALVSGSNTAALKYLELMQRLRSHWTDRPDLYIHYDKLTYTVRVPIVEIATPSFIMAGVHAFHNLFKKLDFTGVLRKHDRSYDLHALAPCSGRIEPGKMTLVLSPPGHGKSMYLKALSGRFANDPHLSGSILYNGQTAAQLKAKGVVLEKLISYVGQQDVHFPVLSVKETLEFAAHNACASTKIFNDPELDKMESERAERLIHMIGLEEATNTIIGNDLLRGISGGQRKRVTLGEFLMTNSRVFCLDEVSTGLDSAITYHIFNALRSICQMQQSSIVTALLQPTPETYGLFDDVVMLRDGEVIYHGRREGVRAFFADVLKFPIPEDEDDAGFIVDYLTNPALLHDTQQRKQERKRRTHARQAEKLGNGHDHHYEDEQKDPSTKSEMLKVHPADSTASTNPALETPDIVSRWQASSSRTELMTEYGASLKAISADQTKYGLDPHNWSQFSKNQFAKPYPHSSLTHFSMAITRQTKLFIRNKQVLIPRLIQAILMGIIYGTLFQSLEYDDYASKFGLLMYLVMYGAFANLSELPVAAEARGVVVKQLDGSFYPSLPYVFSVIFLSIPLIALESIIFGLLMYWMPGFNPDAGNFFFFLLLIAVSSLAMSCFFRSISYCTPNPDVARQLDFPFIVLFIIFGGFLIPKDSIPDWLIWVYWLSPLSWGVRSLALNEFHSKRYDKFTQPGVPSGVTDGNYFLMLFSIDTNDQYKWAGIGYLLGFFFVFAVVSSLAIKHIRAGATLGTKRLPPTDAKSTPADDTQGAIGTAASMLASETGAPLGAINANIQQTTTTPPQSLPQGVAPETQVGNHISVPIGAALKKGQSLQSKSSFHMTGMPFTPVSLAWRDINYYVDVGRGKTKVTKHLLKGINGFAKPGTLTALMGSSGAGKTTLMDVIAGRKTTGVITGEILVNGRPKKTHSFNRLAGYVEQQDIHFGLATVREALEFSATIRLPASVTKEQRDNWINEVMDVVGLTRISHRIIGDAAVVGLAPGQLKLVTIAVELVANPSVLFLDEPTSGLDAPSAFRIMKAVSRIAQTGRSVVCTIHQPSSELFFMFDRLLLLRSGGQEVYFSDIGPHGQNLVDFFENESKSKNPPRLPAGQNPGDWMLNVIGAGVASEEGGAIAALDFEAADWHELWMKSALHQHVMEECEFISKPENAGVDAAQIAINQPYIGHWQRYMLVQKRYFVMHWRNAPTNLSRVILMTCMGILLGLIYLDINKTSNQGIQSFMSVIFLGISFPASVASASAFPSFFRQRAAYYRESTIGMYGYLAYSTAMTIVEIPYIFFALAFFIIPFYFMIGFVNDGSLFFKYYLATYCQALVYSFLSQLWMALCPSQISSNIVNGFFMSLFFMFGGLFIRVSKMTEGWKWFYWIDPVPKTFIAAAMPQFYCAGYDQPGNDCPRVNDDPSARTVYEDVRDQIEGAESTYWPMIGWLILTMGIIRILNLLALHNISHIKR